MSGRDLVTEGLDDVAHCVADAPFLAAIVKAAQAERRAQINMGRVLLEVVRITARHHPELVPMVAMGDAVFGEGV